MPLLKTFKGARIRHRDDADRSKERNLTTVITVTPNPAIDIFTSTETLTPFSKLRCAPPHHDPGGGGINVARVVRRLGGDVVAVFPAGGCAGSRLSQLLLTEGVPTLEIATREETRQDFTIVERSTERQYRFILPGATLETDEWQRCLDAVAHAAPEPRLVVASGSLPSGAPVDFYARLARIARARQIPMGLDCSGEPLKAALHEGVHLIKPNLREFQELVGRPLAGEGDWVVAGRELIARGACQLIALTLGDSGALLIARDQALRADGIPIKATSVVGAGDSFLGGMVWSLAAGNAVEHAFRLGMAAGTAAVLNAGTQLCHADDTWRMLADVRIRKA